LEYARKVKPSSFVLVSTDEVYGPTYGTDYPEWAPIIPSNPYAASKAAQEAIAISYWRTYNVPVMIVNCMNMLGERQDVEKFIPLVMRKVLAGEEVQIHGKPGAVGSRHWLHARNLADAVLFLLNRGVPARCDTSDPVAGVRTAMRPDRFNVGSEDLLDNLTLAQTIAKIMGGDLKFSFRDPHEDRPGHDKDYGLDPGKLMALGWEPPVDFRTSLEKTIMWTLKHPEWLE
jgi:dTDP-glucose 4,6-dehydratase